MKTVFLHGMGQTAHDWDAVLSQASLPDVDCPELSVLPEGKLTYTGLRTGFEKRYTNVKEAFSDMGVSKRDMIRLCHSMRSLNFTARLREVRCPVKILCGEKDRANLKASRQLSELLPQAELHIIPGAGHEINKCAPETIADILNS